jgi:hypothetical protein
MRLFYCFFLVVIISCSQPKPEVSINKLPGYWEIESVILADGVKKDFSFNPIVDFIEIDSMNGVRTKVAPQLDGSFKNNGVAEEFTIKFENDSLNLYYKTPFDSWKETVLKVTDSIFVIRNRDAKIYHYKKFVKFNFTE